MNANKTGIIIRREYLNKVKKKSFLVITFLVPVLFVAMCILPSVIMLNAKEAAKTIAVVDKSGIVMPFLKESETVKFLDMSTAALEEVKGLVGEGNFDAVLSISTLDSAARSLTAETYSQKPLGIDMTENINRQINDAVEAYRIESYNIPGLAEMMEDVKSSVHLTTITLDAEGKETVSESGVYMMVSMILGMIIFMFVTLFGSAVMSSVIEEKHNRVVEVLISSVKATELMFGKIIGVALVACTQFLLWIVLGVVLFAAVGVFAGPDTMSMLTGDTAALAGAGADELLADAPGEIGVIFSTLANLPLGQIFVSFILFFLLGYLLYASLFAAIGSAVENEGDSQQLQLPLTIPLMIGFFIAFYAFKTPDSAVVFWGSMIPFTSPIVMLARIPYGVPLWELVVSLVVLALTVALFAYVSAKIYKVGILMFGKKSTWSDLWKWLKQK